MSDDLYLYIQNHAELLLKDTPWQFRQKADVFANALWAGISAGVQALEDDFFELLVETGFSSAAGFALDQWGSIVGEQREGLSDAEYRLIIRGRLFARACGSTLEEIIEIASSTSEGQSTVDEYPTAIIITVLTDVPLNIRFVRRLRRVLGVSIAAGVQFDLVVGEGDVDLFGFLEDDDAFGFEDGFFTEVVT